MKKLLRKVLLFVVSVSLISSLTIQNPVIAKENNKPLLEEKVEFYKFREEDGKLYLTLPGYLSREEVMRIIGFQEEERLPHIQPASVIGAAIVTISKGIITLCTVEQLFTDDNICRRIYRWLEDSVRRYGHNGEVKLRVVLRQSFIPGRIPGCEPMHSYMCNQGRWEVEFESEEL